MYSEWFRSLGDLDSSEGYLWPSEVSAIVSADQYSQYDVDKLMVLSQGARRGQPLLLTFLTREYLPLGAVWAGFARRAGISYFAIAAADDETATYLEAREIPHFRVSLPTAISKLNANRNRGGFDGRGMALIYIRSRIIKHLVENGIDVTSCDVDALVIRDPVPYLNSEAGVSFQRVIYFPKPFARVWGFAACAGFVNYRASAEVAALLSDVVAIQNEVSSDQLALNLALLRRKVQWCHSPKAAQDDPSMREGFLKAAGMRLSGHFADSGLRLEALPATIFWRHAFVPSDLNAIVVMHPNSPKSLSEKLKVLRSVVGRDMEDFHL